VDLSPNHLPKRSLSRAKRLTTLSLAITIGFSAVVGTVLWDSRGRDLEQAKQAASNVIALLSSEIERNLELYDLSLQAVVDGMKLPAVTELSPAIKQLVLFDRAATAKDMGSIFVLGPDGTVILDSRTLKPSPEIHAGRDYFRVVADNPRAGVFLSRPWRTADGEGFIAISRRLSSADGTFRGVVVGTLRLSYFHKLFSNLQLSEYDSLTLTREDGSVVMRFPFAASPVVQNFASSPIFKRLAEYPTGSFEYASNIDNVPRLYVYQRVGEQPLTLNYGSSIQAIYSSWWHKAILIGVLMFVLCGINFALVVFLTHALKLRSDAEHQLSIMATTDGLTGLCNRRRLDEIFELEWHRALLSQTPIALLMIDADHFKDYNDHFGHQAGDVALKAIAHCVASSARRAADISARYGGEEFAVLLPDTSAAEAVRLAELIRKSVLVLRDDQQGRPDSTPTVSIGVASMIPRQGLQPRDLIKAADTALYQAKSNGRNRTEPAPRLSAASRQAAA
jgi:diguanylate cyclase (GGDEF)-like protein